MLAFSIDYYGMIFRATQSVELFCAYLKTKKVSGTDLTSITPSEMLDFTPRKAESET